MKKILCLLMASLMLFVCSSALAEGVIILSTPETEKVDPLELLRDIQIGTAIDLGDRLILPSDNAIDWNNSETQTIMLYVDVTNLAFQKQLFFKDAKVVVTYTTDRGDYKFGGFVRQGTSSGWSTTFTEIDPLYVGYYRFGCTVPNYVIDNPGPIKMEITFGDYTMIWNVRAE